MSFFASWLASPPPDAAVEIAPERVAVAAIAARGGRMAVTAHASEPLPAGAVTPSLTGTNVADRAAVAGALRRAVERAGVRARRVALVVPDLSARVSLVRFDKVPPRREDLDQLVRWQLKKSAPFDVETASVSYTAGGVATDGSREFVVALARQDAVREYEACCDDAGLYAGLVDLSTFSVANLFLAGAAVPAADWLLVHMRPEFTSLVILRGDAVIFFRSRPEGEDASLPDVVHQTTMYYQDRLAGQGFARVLLGGAGRAPGALEAAGRDLEERLGVSVEAIDPTEFAVLTDRITPSADTKDLLAPLVGMLLRTHREAAA